MPAGVAEQFGEDQYGVIDDGLGDPPRRSSLRIRLLASPTPAGPWGTAMLDDVGTSCATTNATPETSFAPRHGVDAPWSGPETGQSAYSDAFDTHGYGANAPEHST